jgi:hypothetical protein
MRNNANLTKSLSALGVLADEQVDRFFYECGAYPG